MQDLPLRLAALLLVLGACSSGGTAARPLPTTWSKDRVAAVNGVAITTADVALRRPAGHGAADAAGDPIDELIGEELAAQRALELGLDDDAAYQEELHRLEAPVNAFKRQRLAARFYDHLDGEVTVDDAAARRYFDGHATRIRTELRIRQILVRDRAQIEQARDDLAAGVPFEEVARRQYPALPPDAHPWDVGLVRWNQLPEAWRDPLDHLAVGATSDVIAGPRGRYWILELVERREDPTITFDDVEDVVVELVRAEMTLSRREAADRELRARALVIRVPELRR